jgi:enoyl-[acyl-carrier protein] reductase II
LGQTKIRLTKQKTSKPFGINIPMISPHVKEIIEETVTEAEIVVASLKNFKTGGNGV